MGSYVDDAVTKPPWTASTNFIRHKSHISKMTERFAILKNGFHTWKRKVEITASFVESMKSILEGVNLHCRRTVSFVLQNWSLLPRAKQVNISFRCQRKRRRQNPVGLQLPNVWKILRKLAMIGQKSVFKLGKISETEEIKWGSPPNFIPPPYAHGCQGADEKLFSSLAWALKQSCTCIENKSETARLSEMLIAFLVNFRELYLVWILERNLEDVHFSCFLCSWKLQQDRVHYF